jgi:hypothetical protein
MSKPITNMKFYEKMTFIENGQQTDREYHNVNGIWNIELMHEGEWSLYEMSEVMFDHNKVKVFGARLRTSVVHSRIYYKTRPIYTMDVPAMWCGKDEEDNNECVPVQMKTERYDAVCHTELWPMDHDYCTECGAQIPDKFLTVWRMLNSDAMDKTKCSLGNTP